MATSSTTPEQWEQLDLTRTAFAVQEIAASENLRYLFRVLLDECGMNGTPDGGNALVTATNVGRHSVGRTVIETTMEHDPSLYPLLITEDHNEYRDRNED